ncbi:MAG: hypothetical protein H0T59_10985 [Chloroflexi bacterium]|nr:hypothetical protein [Chloroflexota bacterium]
MTEAPNRRRLFSRFSPATGAAAALAIVIGATAIGLGAFGLRGTAPERSPALDLMPPTSVLGIDVISVSAVRAIGAANRAAEREIAVEGWYTPAGTRECPTPAEFAVSPVKVRCPDQFEWLTEAPESLVPTTANTEVGRLPTSPALNPDLDGIDRSWQPRLPSVGTSGSSTPAHVVFVGHMRDRRARLCPQTELDACLQRFVVDKVAWVDGRVPPLSRVDLLDGVKAQSTPGDIAMVVGDQAPDATILSMVTVDGNPGLSAIEPSLGTGRRGVIDHSVLWVVRALEATRLETYIVVDGSDAIYRMTADGDALPIGGSFVSPPEPSDVLAKWPPEGSIVLTLSNPVGTARPPVWVAVVDRSGRLIRAMERASGSADLDVQLDDQGSAAVVEPGHPNRVHLFWEGSICDTRIDIEIAPDLQTIAIRDTRPGCDAIATGRELVLDFDEPVDVTATRINRSTTFEERGYALDCGPLDRATCTERAADTVANYSVRYPLKRIVSINFRGPCDDSDVTFNDGTVIASDTSCTATPSPG